MSKAGLDPGPLDVVLVEGSDFQFTLRCKNAAGAVVDWPVGTAWAIVFDDATEWAATVTGSDAVWDVDKDDHTAKTGSVAWRYVNGTTDLVYWLGKVARRR